MIKPDDKFRWSLVSVVALREAAQSVRSKSIMVVFAAVALGVIGLVGFSASKIESSGGGLDSNTLSVTVGLYMVVAMSMAIMMSSPLLGASMVDEKDNKVMEILLSAIRADELYVGKTLGHTLVGVIQLISLWFIVAVSAVCFGLTTFIEFPWLKTAIILLFMIPGYLVFTAMFGLVGAIISRNEDYLAAQLPVLLVFFASLFVPLLPLFKIGSFESGWLASVAWLPPLSMVGTPIIVIFGGYPSWAVVTSWALLLLLVVLLFFLGARMFKKNILG